MKTPGGSGVGWVGELQARSQFAREVSGFWSSLFEVGLKDEHIEF